MSCYMDWLYSINGFKHDMSVKCVINVFTIYVDFMTLSSFSNAFNQSRTHSLHTLNRVWMSFPRLN